MLNRPQQPTAFFDELKGTKSPLKFTQNHRKRVHVGITNLPQSTGLENCKRGLRHEEDWLLGKCNPTKEIRASAHAIYRENVLVLRLDDRRRSRDKSDCAKNIGTLSLQDSSLIDATGNTDEERSNISSRQGIRGTKNSLGRKSSIHHGELDTKTTCEVSHEKDCVKVATTDHNVGDMTKTMGQKGDSADGEKSPGRFGSRIVIPTMIDRNRNMVLASLQSIAKSPIAPTHSRIIKEQGRVLAIPHEDLSTVSDVDKFGCLQENLCRRTARQFNCPKLVKESGEEESPTRVDLQTSHFRERKLSPIRLPEVVRDHIDHAESGKLNLMGTTCSSNQYQTTNSELFSPIYKANDTRILYRNTESTATIKFEKRKHRSDARYARAFHTLAQHDQARIQEETIAAIKSDQTSRNRASLNYEYLNTCHTKEQKIDGRSQQMQKKHGGDSFLRMWAGSADSQFNENKT
uniref:Uncharacterized protein AlNc14C6G806 n=1 Tax=Albugo laibachii Nc14 TaxID=890382 RepID=F0W127_9STRA|nr:hypothetical protein PITG_05477 [Albugo laibachii Nc14]|eukprot:CCA14751.1 hypothetical protein PITG_05477 [Albugo laibachii Nc14]